MKIFTTNLLDFVAKFLIMCTNVIVCIFIVTCLISSIMLIFNVVSFTTLLGVVFIIITSSIIMWAYDRTIKIKEL